jgi:hypothetical protein
MMREPACARFYLHGEDAMRTEFAASDFFHSPTDRSRSHHDPAINSTAEGRGEELTGLVPSSKEPAVVVQLSEAASELAHHRSPFHNHGISKYAGASGLDNGGGPDGATSRNSQALNKIEMLLGAERGGPGTDTSIDPVNQAAPPQGVQKEKSEKLVKELSQVEERIVMKLQDRDREVRDHEMAHKAAAGPYAIGGPEYEFTKGPDGKAYATGGQVNIDTSNVPNDPQGTMQKMEIVRRAALAPVQPSSQDRQVSADASAKLIAARREVLEARTEETSNNTLGGTAHRAGHWREIWRSSVENIEQTRKRESVEIEVERVGELQLLEIPEGPLEQDAQNNRSETSGFALGTVDGVSMVDTANSGTPPYAQPGLRPENASL